MIDKAFENPNIRQVIIAKSPILRNFYCLIHTSDMSLGATGRGDTPSLAFENAMEIGKFNQSPEASEDDDFLDSL